MAQAIAAHLLARRGVSGSGGASPVRVLSAGTSAYPGMPASPQVAEALESLGIPAIEHAAQPLSRPLLEASDAIFTMSDWHLREIEAMDPDASAKARLVDPEGNDVPDPVGLPQEVYNRTAAALARMIQIQLERLHLLDSPAGKDSA